MTRFCDIQRLAPARLLSLTALLALLGTAGCRSTQQARTPVAVEAKIAQRCPELTVGTGLLDLSKSRIFVEVALLEPGVLSPETSPPESKLSFEGTSTAVTSVMQFVANPHVPTTMPWGDCLDEACDQRNARITLNAQFPKSASDPVSVHLLLEKLPTDAKSSPQFAPQLAAWISDYNTTLLLHDQVPQRIDDPKKAFGSGTTIITSYLLTRPKDLFRLMACKAEQVGTHEIRPVSERP